MDRETDRAYFERREKEETAAAAASQNHRVRAVHLELACQYAVRIAAIDRSRNAKVTRRVPEFREARSAMRQQG